MGWGRAANRMGFSVRSYFGLVGGRCQTPTITFRSRRSPRLVTLYDKSPNGLRKSDNQDGFSSKTLFGAGGSLMSTAEDYLQFAQMLSNGGKLNGKVLLS